MADETDQCECGFDERAEFLEYVARMADAVRAVWGVTPEHAMYLLGDMPLGETAELLTLDSFTHWDL